MKKLRLNRLGYIAATLLIAFVVGYLIYTGVHINEAGL